jgi:hypothetical protein
VKVLESHPCEDERFLEHVEFRYEQANNNDNHTDDVDHLDFFIEEGVRVCHADDRGHERKDRVVCHGRIFQ